MKSSSRKSKLFKLAVFSCALIYYVQGAKTYNENTAYKGIYYSAAAYCKKSTIDDWTCGAPCYAFPNMQEITRFEDFDRNIYGFSAFNQPDNEIVVSFRGTNGLDFKNWNTNL